MSIVCWVLVSKQINTNIYNNTVGYCYTDPLKVRQKVKAIKRQYGTIGFSYDLNDNSRKKATMTDNRKKSAKRARANNDVVMIEPGSEDSDVEPTNSVSKSKRGSNAKLATKWRWNEQRRNVAIRRAVDCNLFSYTVEDGSRDRKMREIVKELNDNTEQDINWVLLTFEAFRKKIYETQRKVLKLKDKQEILETLPEAEQQLYKQLDDIGQVQEADVTKLAGDLSSVSLGILPCQSQRSFIKPPVSIDDFESHFGLVVLPCGSLAGSGGTYRCTTSFCRQQKRQRHV